MKENEIQMQVSAGSKKDGKRQLYVLFSRGKDTAEIRLPDYKLMDNSGFTQEEIGQLVEYTKKSQDNILAMSKEINPIKAIMKV
ncbi:MAG: hypothetical protein J6M27_08590 [Lachnospiraceae bacterium]|nr:hypothetical protein [Lachnospiraceae bacterium]